MGRPLCYSRQCGAACYMRLLQKYKKIVIPAWFQRESGVLLQKIISPTEQFGDDRDFFKRLI